jgi:Alpha galactosidase A
MLRRSVVSRQLSLGRVLGFLGAMVLAASGLLVSPLAEDNGVSLTPQMAWSSWSFIRRGPTETIIKAQAQAQAMHQNLQSSGFQYVNLDDFWYLDPRVTVDAYGRWVPDPTTFPDGMAALAAYIHSLGLKFGMYITPGIPVAAVNANTPIEVPAIRRGSVVFGNVLRGLRETIGDFEQKMAGARQMGSRVRLRRRQ